MSYKEKQVWATMISGLVVMFFYLNRLVQVYRFQGMASFQDLNFWAKTMLIYIGIGVAVVIVVMILLHIVLAISAAVKNKVMEEIKGEASDLQLEAEFDDVEDEMDRLINLKAGQISYMMVGVGFVIGLISLVLNRPPGIMLNIIYLSFMLASAMEGVTKLYYYQRGVSHG